MAYFKLNQRHINDVYSDVYSRTAFYKFKIIEIEITSRIKELIDDGTIIEVQEQEYIDYINSTEGINERLGNLVSELRKPNSFNADIIIDKYLKIIIDKKKFLEKLDIRIAYLKSDSGRESIEKFDIIKSIIKKKLKVTGSGLPIEELTLKDFFEDEQKYDFYLKVLRMINPPIIDSDNICFLGYNDKSAMVAFVDILRNNGIILPTGNKLATVLSNTFKNFSITGKTINHAFGTRDYDKYKKIIEDFLKE